MTYLGAAAAIALACVAMTAPARAAPSAADTQCLACHSTPGFEKPLDNNQTLPLHIDGVRFGESVHAPLGCTGCHTNISLPSHPGTPLPVKDRRDFSLEMTRICQTCHTDQFKLWQTSVHAALVQDGNKVAPICTSCHSPHAVIKGAAATMDTVPCKACHAQIFIAYSGSVHGVLRSGGVTQAPLCFSCHGAHAVHVPSEQQGLKDVCLGCHTEAMDSHRAWLPNVDLHFNVVTCPACHVPHAQRRVDLVLFNSTTQKRIAEPEGVPQFETPASGATTAPGLDPATLFGLLKTLNQPGQADKTLIRGRLEVSTAIQVHSIVPSTEAISDCRTCHQAGANAFQSVVVSVAGPGGIPIKYGASTSVLNSVFSIPSIGGFYAIGGTRITLLDVLFVLALLGGIGGPLAHLIARLVFRHFQNAPHPPRKG